MSLARPIVFIVLFLAASSVPALSQARPDGSRFEVTAGIGGSFATPVLRECCALRTPPYFEPFDEKAGSVLLGAAIRIRETKTLSTVASVDWGHVTEVSREYSPSSASPPLGAYYTSERVARPRTFTVSLSQSLDFLATPRVRPYLSAGLLVSRMAWEQDDISTGLTEPTLRAVNTATWTFTRVGISVDAGVRFYLARRFLIDTHGGVRVLAAKEVASPERWLVPRQSPVFVSVQFGVAF